MFTYHFLKINFNLFSNPRAAIVLLLRMCTRQRSVNEHSNTLSYIDKIFVMLTFRALSKFVLFGARSSCSI